MTAHFKSWWAGLATAGMLLLSACGGGENKATNAAPAAGGAGAAQGGPGSAPPPPAVGVVKVQSADVGLLTELPGRTEASRVAQIRARVAGILQARRFEEGSEVREGQLLFTIDPTPYQAALASAQAQLARAEGTLLQAQAQADRARPLLEAKAISEQEAINAHAARRQAEAEVAAAKAAVQLAQLNVNHASVTAPIAGRIGRTLVTEGALVGQGEATALAVVQQIDPLFVNFTQPAADVLRLRAAIERGQLKTAGKDAAVITLVLEDGSVHPQKGKLLFSDLSVDQATGQISLRAIVPNPKKSLLPGLFVRVQLEQATAPGAMLVPAQAVARGGQGDSVRVVGEDGLVEQRPVKIGPARGNQWVVLEGLKDGEQVMVDGFQKLRGKGPVKPVPWTPGGKPAGGASGGAGAGAGPSAPAASASKPAPAAPAAR
jgi:membrane fusion protein (multidrug efflux system)